MCLLWDITADRDVALYVTDHDIILLAKNVVEISRAPRLTVHIRIQMYICWLISLDKSLNFPQEIMVGILANISCQSEIRQQVIQDSELISLIFSLLSGSDSQVMIQSVRLLDTLLRSLEDSKSVKGLISDTVWENISFIMQSSLNGEIY